MKNLILLLVFLLAKNVYAQNCLPKTDYPTSLVCGEEVFIADSLASLNEYLVSYGDDGSGKAKSLDIAFSLQNEAEIHVPCGLTISAPVSTASDICLDGVDKISVKANLEASGLNILSQNKSIVIDQGLRISALKLGLQSYGKINLKERTNLDIQDSLSIESVANNQKSRLVFDKNVVINAKNISLEALHEIRAKEGLVWRAIEDIIIRKPGSLKNSKVLFGKKVSIEARDLDVSGKGAIVFGMEAFVDLSGLLKIKFNGENGVLSLKDKGQFKADKIRISGGAHLKVGESTELNSKEKLLIDLDVGMKALLQENAVLKGESIEINAPARLKILKEARVSSEGVLEINSESCRIDLEATLLSSQRVGTCLGSDNQPPVADFEAEGTLIVGDAIQLKSFSSDSDGQILRYIWEIDGVEQPDRSASMSYVFSTQGKKTVSLTVIDDHRVASRVEKEIKVEKVPKVYFYSNKNPALIGEEIDLSLSTSIEASKIKMIDWNFGDGKVNQANQKQVSHTYKRSGTKLVTLNLWHENGKKFSVEKKIKVEKKNKKPYAKFFANRTPSPDMLAVTFKNVSRDSDGEIVKSIWDFGDGQKDKSGDYEVIHFYSKPGAYRVSLKVVDERGASSIHSMDIAINEENKAPEVSLKADSGEVYLGENATFIAVGEDPDGGIERYDWDFGDGIVLENQSSLIKYKYKSPGAYNATVTVYDDLGVSASAETTLRVKDNNKKPVAVIKAKQKGFYVGEKISVSSESYDTDGEVVSQEWSSKEGAIDSRTQKRAMITFDSIGEKVIKLKVTDDRGAVGEVSHSVKVVARNIPPVAQFNVLTEMPTVRSPIFFENVSRDFDGRIVEAKWDFGDGQLNTSTETEVSHVYSTPGAYKVNLTVTDNNGVTGSFSQKVLIAKEKNGEINLSSTTESVVILGESVYEMTVFSSAMDGVSQTLLFSYAIDDQGQQVSPQRTWSSDSSVVTITPSGTNDYIAHITAVSPGVANITVSADGITSQPIKVTVHDLAQDSINVLWPRGEFIGSYLSQRNINSTYLEPLKVVARTAGAGIELFSATGSKGEWVGEGDLQTDYRVSSVRANFAPGEKSYEFKGAGLTANKTLRFFDGSKDLLRVKDGEKVTFKLGDDRFIKFDKDFSITFWVKTDDDQFQFEFSDNINNHKFEFSTWSHVWFSDINLKSKNILGGVSTRSNWGWKHIALTYDNVQKKVKLYENGFFKGEVDVASLNYQSIEPKAIVHSSIVQLDNIRFWNSPMTESEIKTEMFTPASSGDSREIAFFDIDGEQGQVHSSLVPGFEMIMGENELVENGVDPEVISSIQIGATAFISDEGGELNFNPSDLGYNEILGEFKAIFPEDSLYNKNIEVLVRDSRQGVEFGYGEDEFVSLSPVYSITPSLATDDVTLPSEVIKISIPLNPKLLEDKSSKDLRVIRTEYDINDTRQVQVLYPDSIDYERGIVDVWSHRHGDFFVIEDSTSLADVEYTSSAYAVWRVWSGLNYERQFGVATDQEGTSLAFDGDDPQTYSCVEPEVSISLSPPKTIVLSNPSSLSLFTCSAKFKKTVGSPTKGSGYEMNVEDIYTVSSSSN